MGWGMTMRAGSRLCGGTQRAKLGTIVITIKYLTKKNKFLKKWFNILALLYPSIT